MRRTAFLSLVGISSDTYKNMCRHWHAPVVHYDVDRDGEVEKESGWTEYSCRDVVMTALAIALNGEGLDKTTASAMVVRGFHLVKHWWGITADENMPPLHFGAALMQTPNAQVWKPLVGPLSHLQLSIKRDENVRFSDVEKSSVKIVTVNLSQLRLDLMARAQSTGLSVDFSYLTSI